MSEADNKPVRTGVDLASLPKTRAEAKALGVDRYFTGKPCKNGHLRERKTLNGSCRRCATIIEERRLKHPRFLPMKNKLAARARKRRRYRVLEKIAAGPPTCIRCGCDDLALLEINHKNGGGGDERYIKMPKGGRLPTGVDVPNRILNGTRAVDDLEVLCRPCNALHWLELKYGRAIPLTVIHHKPMMGLVTTF